VGKLPCFNKAESCPWFTITREWLACFCLYPVQRQHKGTGLHAADFGYDTNKQQPPSEALTTRSNLLPPLKGAC
jgi:hypothetical protein